MKKYITAFLSVVFVFTMFASNANAQAYYPNYAPRTQEETIAFLNGVIAQLIAQLTAQQRFSTNTFQPSGQVLGSTYRGPSYDINVGTGFVRFDGNDITLTGSIDLNRSPYVNVWFEYGDDDDMDDRTSRRRISNRSSFSVEVDDLGREEEIYYRAVAEDPSGRRDYGTTRFVFIGGDDSRRSSRNDDEPDADTDRAEDIDEDSAELNGSIDMNDFRNGVVFFVYGEDEDQIEDVERDYDSYNDVDKDGDDLQKVRVDRDLDGDDDYSEDVRGLDDDTEYFFQICVEYEDDDDDDTLECGGVEDFETDRD